MDDLRKAIEILTNGGIVIFPTDTAYGIGCRIDNIQAVRRLFEIRKRPENQAMPVLVDSISMAENYLLSPISDNVRHLMDKYWPGDLTIVYPCRTDRVPSLVRGGRDTLGVRVPDHKLVLEMIRSVGIPILGPSANFHGLRTPFSYDSLDKDLIKLADFIVKGECHKNKVSTVVDCSITPWKLLRQGAVAIEEL